jgi:ABC-type transporter Mla subunit MlaD
MSEASGNNPQTVQQIQASLHDLAEVLREPHRLDPEAQKAMANLVDELGRMLTTTNLPSPQTAQLAESAAQLAKGLHRQEHSSILAAAKKRLEEAALRAETEAPVATGIVGRLLDTLANLGI